MMASVRVYALKPGGLHLHSIFSRFSLTVVNASKPGGLHLQSILSTDIMENKR
jgi:hypothetical protein